MRGFLVFCIFAALGVGLVSVGISAINSEPDPHTYDTNYIYQWDSTMSYMIMIPYFTHRADCGFCKTNGVKAK